jgi:hypothetical protein
MSFYLNQILYDNKKFDSADTIKLLEPFMHTKYVENSIENISSLPKLQTHPHTDTTNQANTIKDTIQPKNTDTLFWCLYIAKYGYSEYLNIGQKYKNKEIELKQQMIETIKKSPTILKSTSRKVTNVAIQEIMAELMIDKKTTYQTFFAQCLLNGLNIYIIDTQSQTYLPFLNNYDSSNYIIYHSIDGFFSIDIEEKTPEQMTAITESHIELEFGERPIKSISTYKVGDLEIMVKKLGICSDIETKKYKKQELYDKILTKCQWTVVK